MIGCLDTVVGTIGRADQHPNQVKCEVGGDGDCDLTQRFAPLVVDMTLACLSYGALHAIVRRCMSCELVRL